MDEDIITLLRGTRTAVQVAAGPVDRLALMLNNKKGYPPLWLRQKVGSLNDFEGSGGEYIAYLKLLCGLKPGDELLDIGCGCGLICLPINENIALPKILRTYYGLDVDKGMVKWCKRNIKGGNVFFQLITEKEEHLPLASNSFDVVLAKSLFTHLLLSETMNYLREIRRLLRPEGACLATFFLVGDNTRPKGRYRFKYPSVNGYAYYERDTKPELAVAYDEELLIPLIRRLGLTAVSIHYGSWRGDGKGLSFQDIVVLRR